MLFNEVDSFIRDASTLDWHCLLSQVSHLPRADHDPEGRRAGVAAVVPGQPAARPDGPPEEGGHSKVFHTSDPGEREKERETFMSLHQGIVLSYKTIVILVRWGVPTKSVLLSYEWIPPSYSTASACAWHELHLSGTSFLRNLWYRILHTMHRRIAHAGRRGRQRDHRCHGRRQAKVRYEII